MKSLGDGFLSSEPKMESEIAVMVNSVLHNVFVESRTLLIDVLRDRFGLTGTHNGCSYGVCGACTVLIDGVAVRSCTTLAVQAHGSTIETIESVAATDRGMEILEVFSQCRGLQCGFCTPGIVMSVLELDRSIEDLDAGNDSEVRQEIITDVLDGHLCRCTGYAGIKSAFDVILNRDHS